MARPDEIAPPSQIGRYEVRSQIGTGGMGVVYAAHDPALDREVAVKLVRPDRLNGPPEIARERLRREAQITAKLAHPNVVTIYDVGEHDGSVYIAMELVVGASLRQWMRQTVRPWREVLAMFFQAGLGLAAAHEAGLVHRDFKPSNVLVGQDRRARVVDFGLAHAGAVRGAGRPFTPEEQDVEATAPVDVGEVRDMVGDVLTTVSITGLDSGIRPIAADSGEFVTTTITTTVTGVGAEVSRVGLTHDTDDRPTFDTDRTTDLFVGTPAYMAPELFLGQGADARTDQFAFCVSLYEGLYGHRPFAGDTPGTIAQAVLEQRIAPEPRRTRVPGWLRAIVLRGLAREPADRHASLKSLLASIAFTSRIMWE